MSIAVKVYRVVLFFLALYSTLRAFELTCKFLQFSCRLEKYYNASTSLLRPFHLDMLKQNAEKDLSREVWSELILISCWLPCALHAEKLEFFWCPDCQMSAPTAFFRGLTSAGNL